MVRGAHESARMHQEKKKARVRKMQRIVVLFMLLVVTVTSLSNDAEARRRRRRHARAKRAPIINEKKLYERLGGSRRLGEITDEWMRLNLADGRVSPAFSSFTAKPDRLNRERRDLNDQLCEIADGPCQPHEREPAKKTKDADILRLNEKQFLAFGDNLFKSMQKFETPEREKNELLGRLGEAKSDFVEGAKAREIYEVK